ncbi:MAG TPA: hypothetical protein VFH58_15515, partial [Acidimicrobiales bacterium]|nr:hypothetical protein [Acidimicrobiales bacterium]
MSAAVARAELDGGYRLPVRWAGIVAEAPVLAAVMATYLEGLARRLNPRSVAAAEVCLRQFASHLIATDPACRSTRDVHTGHLEAWGKALSEDQASPWQRGVSPDSVAYKLATLRRFFESLTATGHVEAPGIMPVLRQSSPRPRRASSKRQHPSTALKPCAPDKAKPPHRALPRETTWAEIAARAPQMAATMAAYVEQLGISHRPASAEAASLALRHLAAFLVGLEPPCRAVADISRGHIEAYKVALAARPGQKGPLT